MLQYTNGLDYWIVNEIKTQKKKTITWPMTSSLSHTVWKDRNPCEKESSCSHKQNRCSSLPHQFVMGVSHTVTPRVGMILLWWSLTTFQRLLMHQNCKLFFSNSSSCIDFPLWLCHIEMSSLRSAFEKLCGISWIKTQVMASHGHKTQVLSYFPSQFDIW